MPGKRGHTGLLTITTHGQSCLANCLPCQGTHSRSEQSPLAGQSSSKPSLSPQAPRRRENVPKRRRPRGPSPKSRSASARAACASSSAADGSAGGAWPVMRATCALMRSARCSCSAVLRPARAAPRAHVSAMREAHRGARTLRLEQTEQMTPMTASWDWADRWRGLCHRRSPQASSPLQQGPRGGAARTGGPGRTAAQGHAVEPVQQLQLRARRAVHVAGGHHGRAAQVARAALRGRRAAGARACAPRGARDAGVFVGCSYCPLRCGVAEQRTTSHDGVLCLACPA